MKRDIIYNRLCEVSVQCQRYSHLRREVTVADACVSNFASDFSHWLRACKNVPFRKVWFYYSKRITFSAKVCFYHTAVGSPPPRGRPGGCLGLRFGLRGSAWGGFGGIFTYLWPSVRFFFFTLGCCSCLFRSFRPRRRLFVVILPFRAVRGPP